MEAEAVDGGAIINAWLGIERPEGAPEYSPG